VFFVVFSWFSISKSIKVRSQHVRAAPTPLLEHYTPRACVLHISERSATLASVRTHTFKTGGFNSAHRRCKPELHPPTETFFLYIITRMQFYDKLPCVFFKIPMTTTENLTWGFDANLSCTPPRKHFFCILLLECNFTISYHAYFSKSQ